MSNCLEIARAAKNVWKERNSLVTFLRFQFSSDLRQLKIKFIEQLSASNVSLNSLVEKLKEKENLSWKKSEKFVKWKKLPHDDELKFFFMFQIQGKTLSGADEEMLENIYSMQYTREYF